MEEPQPSASNSSVAPGELVKWLHQAAEAGDLERIRVLLSSLEVEKRNFLLTSVEESKGELPFHGAARGGHNDILELLLPESLQHLTNTQSKQGGWSSLHLAAAYGHAKVVQWLFVARMADLNLQDEEGNTPVHLAVALGHKDVVRYLVIEGANLFSLNNDGMMPISLCKDPAMFEALFSNYSVGSLTSFNRARPIVQRSWPHDADNKTILHYAAQFATDSDGIAKLIAETEPDQLHQNDNQGDSFLHVAAKSGNKQVLQALKKLDSDSIDVNELVSNKGNDPLHSPGLHALLYNHREFFNELITMGKVEITLRCIIKGLIAELIDKPEIEDRLVLFASTLPTYLALYANKECIFNFLLETKIISLSQWDDELKRTCLHRAVLDNRIDIVEKLCRNVHLRPGIQDRDGKTALQHAFEQKNHMIMDILRGKRSFKEYEEKLDRDREVYVQALNSILVGAALIASVTFAGWLQLPSHIFDTLSMKIFWASNCISFFTAVATMCVTTTALLPTPSKYVGDIVNQLRLAIVMDAGLLALSLAAVMWAFAAAGFAALHDSHIFSYQGIMRGTTAVGGFLCLVVWIAFVLQLYRCAPPRSVLFALILPSLPHGSFWTRWWPASFQNVRARIGDSSRFGYLSRLRSELKAVMDEDLVAYHSARQPAPGTDVPPALDRIPLHTMQQILGKIDIADAGSYSYLEKTYKQKEDEIAYKQRKEGVSSHIIHHFDKASTVA